MIVEIQSKKLAVLIDADNASISSVSSILEEVAKYGIASVKRIYGDWSNPALKGWYDIALKYGMTPVQQYAYTVSKNATDIAMVIDAMELLYTGTFQGFCIISSDSDFTPLASRIRENGLIVYGFGRKTTPEPFKQACDKFISVENLVFEEKEEIKQNSIIKKDNGVKESIKIELIDKDIVKQQIDKATLNLIYKAVKDNSDDSGWAYLGLVGAYITTVKPDFDTRNYGHDKLSGLVKALGVFEIKMQGSQMYLRKSSFSSFIRLVQKAIYHYSEQNDWVNIQDVVEYLKNTDLNIRNYEEAIESIHSGWLEFKDIDKKKFTKINKVMV